VIVFVRGLDEVIARMRSFPVQMRAVANRTLMAVLLFIWSKVPGYPPQPKVSGDKVSFKTRAGEYVEWGETAYRRTGTLGRTLGVGEGGGQLGQPQIYDVRNDGGYQSAHFGTRLDYAPYVIGDYAEEQAGHMRHWWTIPQDLLHAAYDGIVNLFTVMTEELAAWIERKGE
jgi:hypothetical protein